MDSYRTTDPNEAAFIMARGHLLRDVRSTADGPGHWRVFLFDGAAEKDGIAFKQDAPIPARSFARARRDVHSLLRQA